MRAASPANAIRKITNMAGFRHNRRGEWDGLENGADVGRIDEHWNIRNIVLSWR
jgi:hypothetical protein